MRRILGCLVACAAIALAGLTVLRAGDLPKLPENVRELMQDRKYDDAAAAIDLLLAAQADKPKNPDYLLYLKGRALHLASKHREALETFARMERDYADSPWVRRARFGQAAALLKLGDFEAAEHIYEDEVKFLLSTERKHEIASIYLEFADAYFDPPKKPGDGATVSEKKPDYTKALNFYRQALAVGPEADRRTEVEFRIARCQQEIGQHAEAIAAYQAFLKAHPTSKADIEARYQLGTIQLALGQHAEARRTWKDLLDAHGDQKLELLNELLDAYPNRDTQRLAEAAYGMSHTYGIPNPPSKEDLELGVAAADRFIANFPDIKLAARSAFEIAQGFVSQNRHDEARDRLQKLLANPKYSGAEVIPDARVLLGFVYQRQKKFSEANAVWQEYLAKHAAHPSWSQVQQAIIDTEFLTALEMRREGSRHSTAGDKKDSEKSYAEARRLWTAFLDRYPLDSRAASIMLEFGLMNFEIGELTAKHVAGDAAGQNAAPVPENDRDAKLPSPDAGTQLSAFRAAMADWTSLVSKYPNTEEASRGQFLIGMTYEEKLGKFDDALAAYRKLTWGQFAPRAAERVSRLTRQELAIETERVFRTNQQPRIRVTTRNVRQLTVKAYRVDLETYFRKMHLARGIEALDVALIDPEKTWTFDVPDYADYKQLTSRIDVPLDFPGVMAVTVANEAIPLGQAAGLSHLTLRPQEATTMVMRSDLDILVKCSRNELFVFAENMRTGKPFAGVKLLVSDGSKVFAEATTGDDGVFVGSVSDTDKTWEPLKASNDIRVFALTQDSHSQDRKESRQGTSTEAKRDQLGSDASGQIEPAKHRETLRDLQNTHIIVRIKADNTIWLDDDDKHAVEADDLKTELEKRWRARNLPAGLIISADAKANHETVVAVVDAASLAGTHPIKLANPPGLAKSIAASRRGTIAPPSVQKRAVTAPDVHFASNVIGLKGIDFAQGISSKGYVYTERPTYRPGQLVHVRGVVRWVKGDEYFFEAGKKFKLDVYDSRGRQIRSEEVTLGEFGSFATHLALPAEAPQGDYRLHVHDPAEPDKHNYQGTFAVHEYQLQPVLIEIDTPQKVYYRGDQVSGTIKLKYYYGSPVTEREIRYVLPDGTIHSDKTDAAGEVAFKFDTREFREDQMLAIVVQYPELNLRAGLNLFLSTHGFRATIATARDVYLAGETFDVTVSTTDAAGIQVGEKLTLSVVERTEVLGQVGERTVEEQRIATDKEYGSGRATIKIASAGSYILRATGTDRFGNPVSAERTVTVSGDEDTVRLRILSDRHHYKAGDIATVQVHWREQPALALVTYQGARVLGYRLVELEKGSNKLAIPITEKLAPNFDLTVSVMSDFGGERRQNISATVPRGGPSTNANPQQPPVLPEPQPECASGTDELKSELSGQPTVEQQDKPDRLLRVLDSPITVNFVETPLKDIVDFLSEVTAANFVLDSAALKNAGISLDTPISVKLERIPLKSMLKLVLEQFNLTYAVRDNVIFITSVARSRGSSIAATSPEATIETDRPVPSTDAADDAGQAGPLPAFHEASSPFEVERPLVLTIKPTRDRVLPGEDVEVAITASDPQGKPVRAELSLAMIEKSLLEMFPDQLAAIAQFFEGSRRSSALNTVASCTFRYEPATRDISQTLLAEAARVATVEMERASREAALSEPAPTAEFVPNLSRVINGSEDFAKPEESGVSDLKIPFRTGGFAGKGKLGDHEKNLTDLIDKGLAWYSEGKFPEAALAARRALEADPDNVAAIALAYKAKLEMQLHRQLDRGRSKEYGLDGLKAFDESTIPFDDEMSIKYPEARTWEHITESRTIIFDPRIPNKTPSQMSAQQLRGYASVLAGDSKRTAGKNAQLGVLLGDGSVNFLNAATVAAGKAHNLPTGANVVVLPEFQMRETGYWNPAIVTDGDGKATVTITVPDRSTAWQLATRGITTGTLTGQATSDLTAKKDLFGELKLPIAFVDGDSAQILATIHNDAVANGKIEVKLKTTIAGKSRDEKRTIDVAKRGTHELVFDREIAGTGEAVFELAVSAAQETKVGIAPEGLSDSTRVVVPIRPYGVPVFTTTGGSASSNMTAWVSPPAGMPVRDPSLQIVIGPSVERSLLDVVLAPTGSLGYLECHRLISGESALERTTSDLMASLGLMKLIGESREKGSPESTALADRIRSSIGYLISSQNDDGGWHWSAARGAKQGSSDRNASARALWALALARKTAFAVPDDAFNKAITFAQSAFTTARENDYDGKALLLHALAAAGRGDFAYANRLYRSRTSLSPTALAYLSLAFVEMDRKEIARELLDLLAPKLAGMTRLEPANGSGERPTPAGPRPQGVPPAEVQALYLHGLNATAEGDPKLKDAADWLLAHRAGSRWQPERATGPATLALAEYFATTRFAADHYKLKLFVNDHEVAVLDIDGAGGSRVVDVPKEVLARGEKLPERDFSPDAKKQRINFELTGRGRFTFNCVYSGFVAADQLKNTVNAYHIERHYEPAPLELDGKEIPRGFDILDGPITTWRNPVTELPVGRRAQVLLYYYPINGHLIPEDEREYVVITEPIPSGCSVLEKSITGQFDRYEIGLGYIAFYVGNRTEPNEIRFDLYGYTAGKYRTAPTIVRNFYDPERMMVTQPHPLTVLAAGQKSKDEYRVTPRELYELGKRNVQKALALERPAATQPAGAEDLRADVASYATAGKYLAELFDKFQLKSDIYKEVTQMLFEVSLAVGKAPDIVRYFEVLKEKWPDLEVAFGQIVRVGAAYRELNEYERSYLVFRATVEGSFIRESQIGGFLESQGEFERSITVMDRILHEYPAEPYIASATYALAQRVYAMAPNAAGDAKLRERKTTKIDLIRDAVGRLDDFLTVWPDDPASDQASFSLASALIELEAWPTAIARANRFAERFPNSEYRDSFWYIIGYSHFERGEHRAALDMCRRVAEATYTDPATGRAIESRNKWRAIYISGQVHHSLGEPADAIVEYNRVADRFPDAKETIAYFTRKAIDLPEITAVKPPSNPKLEPGAAAAAQDGDGAANGQQPDEHAGTEVELKFRNVASCEVKVYRIDLLKFGLLHRDLANVTKINLAGIQPLYEATIELGDGKDFRDRTKKLELPLQDEGAYLVVCRGDDLHTSGLVLVTPLVVEVQEEASSGRVRATVKNSVTDTYASDVHVKVIGSRNDKFKDGPTDLRGVFVADGIQGRATVIARAGAGQYAFHRGQQELGPPPAAAPKPPAAAATAAEPGQSAGQQQLLEELFQGNRMIQQQKGTELKELYEKKPMGVPAQQAF